MASARTIALVELLVWVLIFGGLLTLVLGLATRDASAATSWTLISLGALATAGGVVLIWVRSRLRLDSPPAPTHKDPP